MPVAPDVQQQTATASLSPVASSTVGPGSTPLPTRTLFSPGQLVPYTAQTGDTLPALAIHFNTTVEEIRAANPTIPDPVSTLPPGFPMEIPTYNLPLTGTPFQILPDSEVPNGPGAIGFDTRQEVLGHPGFLSTLSDYAFGQERESWQVVETVAENYSVHPRLLLTLLEYRTHALTKPFPDGDQAEVPLGIREGFNRGLYRQLLWAAERINQGFYGWRTGRLREFETRDGFLIRPDPWQNAGTVAIQYLLAGMYNKDLFDREIGPDGFQRTYRSLWGDPFANGVAAIPGNLLQPEWPLPFLPDRVWDFSGGPHPSWGDSLPWGALDFAPPAVVGGCAESEEWAVAPAGGVVTRSENALVVLDLDGDGDERTGWLLVYFHIATNGRIAAGAQVVAGDRIGHPSCEGGLATGTHFHIARRFNGEWMPAAGPVPFTLDRWVAFAGEEPYEGTLVRGTQVVPACTCSTQENRILYRLPGGETEIAP
jgi:LasA protease